MNAGETRRPKVLFVAYGFPPARSIGCVRTWNIAKHLARAGWDVTVLTIDPTLRRYVESVDATTARLEQEGIRRLLSGHRLRWLAPNTLKSSSEPFTRLAGGIGRRLTRRLGVDWTIGWVREAERACSLLTPSDVDVVLASGPPFSAFVLARRLARRLGCPYVLDYRDLWSRNLHNPVPAAARTEAALISGAAAVTIVSPSWGNVLNRDFGVGSKLRIVSNGYDPEDLAKVAPQIFDHFAIVYAGALMPPKRVISPVMAALRCLAEQNGPSWRFHYYGKHQDHVREEALRYEVIDRVVLHGLVSRTEALGAVKGAGVTVVITSVVEEGSDEHYGMVTGKIFEAIGMRTPILLIAPRRSDANLVAQTAGLVRSVPASDIDGMSCALRELVNGNTVSLGPKDPGAYSWENVVVGLDALLRDVALDGRLKCRMLGRGL